jgi:hypothetical protein
MASGHTHLLTAPHFHRGGVCLANPSVGNLEGDTERHAATLAWMRQSFALVNQQDSQGLMLFLQANPSPFTPSDGSLNGFEEFVVALEEETLKFRKPVVLAHGDSRYFRVYKPYRTVVSQFELQFIVNTSDSFVE